MADRKIPTRSGDDARRGDGRTRAPAADDGRACAPGGRCEREAEVSRRGVTFQEVISQHRRDLAAWGERSLRSAFHSFADFFSPRSETDQLLIELLAEVRGLRSDVALALEDLRASRLRR